MGNWKLVIFYFGIVTLAISCDMATTSVAPATEDSTVIRDTIAVPPPEEIDSLLDKNDSLSALAVDTQKVATLKPGESIDVRNVNPEEIITFAQTLVGTPYVYGSTDPKVGFDCSGFITYVFNHFKINVPRSSVQFTNIGKTVPLEEAKRGDIVLFTDPDVDSSQTSSEVGHMGLILENNKGVINFIHSTSGKAMSVAITPLSDHYKKRFVRVGRIFPQNDR